MPFADLTAGNCNATYFTSGSNKDKLKTCTCGCGGGLVPVPDNSTSPMRVLECLGPEVPDCVSSGKPAADGDCKCPCGQVGMLSPGQ